MVKRVARFLSASVMLALFACPIKVCAEPLDGPIAPLPQIPSAYQFMVGDLRITSLSDGTVPQDLHTLLINTDAGEVDGCFGKDICTIQWRRRSMSLLLRLDRV